MDTETQDQHFNNTDAELAMDVLLPEDIEFIEQEAENNAENITNPNTATNPQLNHPQLVSNLSSIAATNGLNHSQVTPTFIPLGTLIMYDERDQYDGTVSCQLQYKLPLSSVLEVVGSPTLSGFDLPPFHHWTIKFRKQVTNLNVSIWFKGGHNLGIKINLFTPKPDIDLNRQLGPEECDLLFSCSYTPNQFIKHQGIWFTVTSGIENWSKKLVNLADSYKEQEGEPVMIILVADIRFTRDSAWDANIAEIHAQRNKNTNPTTEIQKKEETEDSNDKMEVEEEQKDDEDENNELSSTSGTQLKEFDLSKLPDPEEINDPMDTSE